MRAFIDEHRENFGVELRKLRGPPSGNRILVPQLERLGDEDSPCECDALCFLVGKRFEQVAANHVPVPLAIHRRRPAVETAIRPQKVQKATQGQFLAICAHGIGFAAALHGGFAGACFRQCEIELESSHASIGVFFDRVADHFAQA